MNLDGHCRCLLGHGCGERRQNGMPQHCFRRRIQDCRPSTSHQIDLQNMTRTIDGEADTDSAFSALAPSVIGIGFVAGQPSCEGLLPGRAHDSWRRWRGGR
jgi:hypothetical protein